MKLWLRQCLHTRNAMLITNIPILASLCGRGPEPTAACKWALQHQAAASKQKHELLHKHTAGTCCCPCVISLHVSAGAGRNLPRLANGHFSTDGASAPKAQPALPQDGSTSGARASLSQKHSCGKRGNCSNLSRTVAQRTLPQDAPPAARGRRSPKSAPEEGTRRVLAAVADQKAAVVSMRGDVRRGGTRCKGQTANPAEACAVTQHHQQHALFDCHACSRYVVKIQASMAPKVLNVVCGAVRWRVRARLRDELPAHRGLIAGLQQQNEDRHDGEAGGDDGYAFVDGTVWAQPGRRPTAICCILLKRPQHLRGERPAGHMAEQRLAIVPWATRQT